MRNKNVYMGRNSTAQMPVFGTVDTDYEIVLNAISTAYDALNEIMLTRQPGVFEKTTVAEINGRFGTVRMLARRYAPRILPAVDEMHHICLENHAGRLSDVRALVLMREISTRYGMNPGILDEVCMRINNAEMLQRHPPVKNYMEQMFPYWNQKRRRR